MKKQIALVLAASLFALPALGDVVHLKNGGSLEGQVTVTDDGATIRLPAGEVRVSRDAIERIEKKESAFEQYLTRAAGVRDDDDEAHFKLGQWAQGAGLKAQAAEEFEKTLMLKPDHEGAHLALGHKKVDGAWLAEYQGRMVKRDGQWMTGAAAARYDALKAELEAAREKRQTAEAALQKAKDQPPLYTYDAYYAGRSVPYSSYYYSPSYVPYSYTRPILPYGSYYSVGVWPYRSSYFGYSGWSSGGWGGSWHGGGGSGHHGHR